MLSNPGKTFKVANGGYINPDKPKLGNVGEISTNKLLIKTLNKTTKDATKRPLIIDLLSEILADTLFNKFFNVAYDNPKNNEVTIRTKPTVTYVISLRLPMG